MDNSVLTQEATLTRRMPPGQQPPAERVGVQGRTFTSLSWALA